MWAVISGLGASSILSGAVVLIAHYYWDRVNEGEGRAAQWAFLVWLGKGLVVPAVIWVAVNTGWFVGTPVLLPEVVALQARGGNWRSAALGFAASGVFVVASYWAAATLAWVLATILRRMEAPRDLVTLAVVWTVLMSPLLALTLFLGGWAGIGLAIVFWMIPIVHSGLPFIYRPEPLPSYSHALARMKFGKYNEAETSVIGELEKCENDFDGWMMLADLYANHFNELAEADRTIRELCSQPGINAVQASLAFHRLADWHLKPGQNPAAARAALEEIGRLYPGSHVARMARQRIDRLPVNREALRHEQARPSLRLPALGDTLDRIEEPAPATADRIEDARLANEYVEILTLNPNDTAVREMLAVLYAERLGKFDWGVEQLELLMAMPEQADSKKAEWLGLMAAWQIRFRRDGPTARLLLDRILREYPNSVQAMAARRRIELMEMDRELRGR